VAGRLAISGTIKPRTDREDAPDMRAETQATVDSIRESMALLRRHL
jgi:hypothetical protein